MTVVTILKLDDRSPDFLQVPEDATVNGLFLQRPVEALSDAIRLRFGDEGEARRDAPEPDLVQEVIGRVLRTVIHAQRQAPTNLGTRAAEFAQQSLCDRLQGGEPVARLDRMDTDAAGVAMIDRGEHPDPAVIHGLDAHAVGAPHLVRAARRDRAVVLGRLALGTPMWRQQGVLPHQTQHTGAGDPDVAQDTQPRPYLAVPLTDKRRGRQIGADGLQKVSVGHLWFRAAPLRHEWHHVARLACLTGIDRRTRESKHPADPLQPIRLAGASGGRAAHFDDLRLPKGCRACLSLRRISTSMTSSPMRRVASPSFASSGSFSRSLRPASIPARARSRHSSSLYIGTDTSREMASTGSPRNRRRTTSFFLLADQRLTSAAAPGALPVALRAPSTAPGTTSATFDFFSIFNAVSRHRFYPKFVSRKIGGGSAARLITLVTDLIRIHQTRA